MKTCEASTSAQPAGAALGTGGGSGIGLACAQRLASAGMAVTIGGRSGGRLGTALESLPAGSRHVVADITDEAAMGEAMDRAVEGHGSLAAVVANAGGAYAVGPLAMVDVADFERELHVNVTGTFVTIKAARSEAHTSELQSLMRISYAVFC